jgi:hypothetical protein
MAFRFFNVIADLQPRTTGLPYTSFRIARKGFEGIGKVVFPNGEFSTLTSAGYWESIVSGEVVECRLRVNRRIPIGRLIAGDEEIAFYEGSVHETENKAR